jgi:hypothetical protein
LGLSRDDFVRRCLARDVGLHDSPVPDLARFAEFSATWLIAT